MLPPSSHRHVLAARIVASVVVVVAGLTGAIVWAPPAGAAPTTDEQRVATMVNDFRIAHGKAPLALHGGMSDDARAWSSRMATSGFAHDPDFARSCDRFPGHGTCVENVGYGASADRVELDLEGSAPHRANLLCDCTHLGVGVVTSNGRTFVTQRFVHDGGSAMAMRASMSAEEVTAAERFVRSAYADLLGRPPTTPELDHWTSRVGSPAQRAELGRSLGYSDEWVGSVVDTYYQVALGRRADEEGRAYWVEVIRRHQLAPADVAAHFYASDEYFARRGEDVGAWVDDLYQELLQRAADEGGRSHWMRVAQSYGRPTVATNVYDSIESLRRRVDQLYVHLLGRRAEPSGRDGWAQVLHRTGNDVDLAVTLMSSTEYWHRAQTR